jgi:hypothetical protein
MAALILFAALMGVAVPELPHHAVIADGLVVIALFTLRPSLQVASLAYLAWAGVVTLVHGFSWKLLGVGELVCVASLAAALNEEQRTRVMRAWILGAAALAVVGLVVSSLSGVGIQTPWTSSGGELVGWRFRPQGLALSTNLLASLCLVPFLVVLAERRWALVALFAAVLFLSVSRTTLAAGVGVLLLYRPRGWRLAVAALALVMVASVVLDVHVWTWRPDTLGIRARILVSTLRTIAEHPVFGVWTQTVAMAARPGGEVTSWDAHNTILNVAATLGLPALVAYSAIWWKALRVEGVLRVALWATLFDALTLDVEDFRHVWLLLGLASAQQAKAAGRSFQLLGQDVARDGGGRDQGQ